MDTLLKSAVEKAFAQPPRELNRMELNFLTELVVGHPNRNLKMLGHYQTLISTPPDLLNDGRCRQILLDCGIQPPES